MTDLEILNDFVSKYKTKGEAAKELGMTIGQLSNYRFAALCLFAPCTEFQVTTNVDGANSTKPLLYAGTVKSAET